jgi:hypothetical protein
MLINDGIPIVQSTSSEKVAMAVSGGATKSPYETVGSNTVKKRQRLVGPSLLPPLSSKKEKTWIANSH